MRAGGGVWALKEAAYWSLWNTPLAESSVPGRGKDRLKRARPTSRRKKPGDCPYRVCWGAPSYQLSPTWANAIHLGLPMRSSHHFIRINALRFL